MDNIMDELKFLCKNNVHIKNPHILQETLNNMRQAGVNKLQVVSDFDRTITKQHEDGIPHLSSFAMFSRTPTAQSHEQYQTTVQGLRKKYYPIEIDPKTPFEEKIKHMEEWWSLSEKAIRGLKVSQKEIDNICQSVKPSLRERTKEFFEDLASKEVPVLVFSAGCGDVVLTILKQCDVYLSNVKVISNFLKYNDEGAIEGFCDRLIHVFNKNEYAIKNSEFYDLVRDRDNAIVLGDSLGDAGMTDGMENLKSVLKIGFLYEHVDEALPSYMETFDIVLVDDQTMDVPKAMFDYIKSLPADSN